MIFDPIVVKVYGEDDEHQRAAFKNDLVNTLRRAFGMTLTCSPDSLRFRVLGFRVTWVSPPKLGFFLGF